MYFYRVGGVDSGGQLEWTDPVAVTTAPSSGFTVAFGRIGPSPFHAWTSIEFVTVDPAVVDLTVYDVTGRLVRTLSRGPVSGGAHEVRWDGRDARGRAIGAGVYFLRLDVDGVVRSERVQRLR